MREKSVQKFKARIRELTIRKQNLDAEAVKKVNRVIRGNGELFRHKFLHQSLDVPKTRFVDTHAATLHEVEAKEYNDNGKLRVSFFRHQLKLFTLEEFCTYRDTHGKARRVTPRHGATSLGVAR